MYLLDGAEVSYEVLLEAVFEALESNVRVAHAYHRGADCYWIGEDAPWHARPVNLTDNGLEVEGRVLESLAVV